MKSPTKKHSQKAWGILITHFNGEQEFLTVGMTMAITTNRNDAEFIIRERKRIAEIAGTFDGSRAKIVRVVVSAADLKRGKRD